VASVGAEGLHREAGRVEPSAPQMKDLHSFPETLGEHASSLFAGSRDPASNDWPPALHVVREISQTFH